MRKGFLANICASFDLRKFFLDIIRHTEKSIDGRMVKTDMFPAHGKATGFRSIEDEDRVDNLCSSSA